MRKFAIAVLVGLVCFAGAALFTVFDPFESTLTKIFVVLLWFFSVSLIVFALQQAIRDTRRRLRALNRAVKKHASNIRKDDATTPPSSSEQRISPKWHGDVLLALTDTLPSNDGSHHYQRAPVRMIVIAPNPERYKVVFSEVLYEDLSDSDFEDADGVYVVLDDQQPRPESVPLLHRAFEANKPIIIQLVGDVDYIFELDIAKYATAVFHPDGDVLDALVRRLGHNRVFLGCTGIDTTVVNPVGSQRYQLESAFYFDDEVPNRHGISRDVRTISAELANAGRLTEWSDIAWSSSAEWESAFSVHKLFCYAVNVSPNKESTTDAGPRLKHLQAMGLSVLSNYTVSIFNQLPWTRIVAERMPLNKLFEAVSRRNSDVVAQIGLQEVVLKENFFATTSKQLQQVGLTPANQRSNHILVVALGDIGKVRAMVHRQTHTHHTVVEPASLERQDLAMYGYVAAMSGDIDYGRDYLRGRLAAFIYADQLVVTQENGYIGGTYTPGRVHEVAKIVPQPELSLVSTEHPRLRSLVVGELETAENVYLVDHYQADFKKFVWNENQRKSSGPPRLSVIIPIYNNGVYLTTKAIPSLSLNDCFADMDVILVDDGSTDAQTIDICEELAAMYPQIRFFAFNDGGSGSASRPRNYGLDMAKAELVTFLDPDNEISIGGYDKLLARFDEAKSVNSDVEFVSGYQAKVATRRAYTGRHTKTDLEIVTNFRQRFFNQGEFPVVSTQAAVVSRKFFERTGLRFVERAVGQDTLFGWELLLEAKAGAFVKDAFLLYYAERGDSVTNVVGSNYFARVLINEKAKLRVLEQHGLLEIYSRTHLPKFIESWYIPRLERVPSEEYQTAKGHLEAIVELYDQELDDYLN